jgi:hypothetical protein
MLAPDHEPIRGVIQKDGLNRSARPDGRGSAFPEVDDNLRNLPGHGMSSAQGSTHE